MNRDDVLQKKQQKSCAANSAASSGWDALTPSPLTPAMEEVIAMRQKRISVEIDTPITPGTDSSVNLMRMDSGFIQNFIKIRPDMLLNRG